MRTNNIQNIFYIHSWILYSSSRTASCSFSVFLWFWNCSEVYSNPLPDLKSSTLFRVCVDRMFSKLQTFWARIYASKKKHFQNFWTSLEQWKITFVPHTSVSIFCSGLNFFGFFTVWCGMRICLQLHQLHSANINHFQNSDLRAICLC